MDIVLVSVFIITNTVYANELAIWLGLNGFWVQCYVVIVGLLCWFVEWVCSRYSYRIDGSGRVIMDPPKSYTFVLSMLKNPL